MFAVSAILALALGIGANTAVFSVVYSVLLKPLPYAQPERLVQLAELNPAQPDHLSTVSAGTFVDWRARSRALETLAVYTIGGDSLWTLGDRIVSVNVSAVSPVTFSMLGASPILGRGFAPESDKVAEPQFVISYALWQRAFGGAPDVIGRRVQVEGRFPREIIGVMPRGFAFPERTDAWTRLALDGAVPPARRRAMAYRTIARLSPHTTLADARIELSGISSQLAVEQPASNAGWAAQVVPFAGSDAAGTKPALLALLGAVAGVLLIACANVANLLLARATARRREMAVRLALGAGTLRLVRQCLTEALVLSAMGTVAGVALGRWLAALLVHLAPPDIPRLNDVGVDMTVLAFAATAGVLCAAIIGLAPALQAVRADRDGGLRPDTRTASARGAGVRRWLIGGEVAVVVLLLTGALLLVRTFVNLRGVDLGFHPDHVLSVESRWPLGRMVTTSPPGSRPWPKLQRAVDGLVAAVASVPGVEAAGLISDVPLTGDPFSGSVWRADAPGADGLKAPSDPRDRWHADLSVVTSGYFPAMDIPLLRGRNFSTVDRLSDDELNAHEASMHGVVIVNNAFASRYFPGEDPIGRALVIYDDQAFGWLRTIVGVVGDVRGRAVAEAPRPAVYVPHPQHPDVFRPTLAVRSSLPPDAIAAAIRQRITEVDPLLLVQRIRPMDDVVSSALSRPRFNLLLLSSFALIALALSAVGIYGVLAYLVAQRTREIGIRMALGARARDVVSLVLKEGMAPVLVGGAAGLVASLLATQLLRTLLFGVTPLDPVSLVAAPAILATVALVACYVPARRAAAVDPLVALRDE